MCVTTGAVGRMSGAGGNGSGRRGALAITVPFNNTGLSFLGAATFGAAFFFAVYSNWSSSEEG